ncbi:MAG TPA: hypothetical protein DCM07_32645, partial [Planctomycetaceae bacterium]|nr:hypothetical protein [Planctomycetaceae bacterium]
MTLHRQSVKGLNLSEIDQALEELTESSQSEVGLSVARRIELTEQCLRCLSQAARDWVDLACQAKQIPREDG